MNPPSSPLEALLSASDETLAREARHDYAAFAELYHRYFLQMYGYQLERAGNTADAEYLTTLTFLAALNSIPTYQGETGFGTWLMNIAQNQAAPSNRFQAAENQQEVQHLQPDPAFEAALERKLIEQAKKIMPIEQRRSKIGKTLFIAMLAIGLISGIAWALIQLLPHLAQPAATLAAIPAAATPTVAPTAQPVEPTSTAAPAALTSVNPDPEGAIYSLPVQPKADFYLHEKFPEGPGELNLYRQIAWEPLTVDSARAAAANIGILGDVYLWSNVASGSTSYMVWDGQRRITFFDSPRSFEYLSTHPALMEQPSCQPPCLAAGAEANLTTFLSEHGLLDIPFIFRPAETAPQVMNLIQTLDAIPIQSGSGSEQSSALVGSQGVILRLDYLPINTEIIGQFPILSAEQAWESASNYRSANGVIYFGRPPAPKRVGTWLRGYPLNESVEIFANLQVFQPAGPGSSALVLLDGFPLSGSVQGMTEAAANTPFVQVWGQFQQDEDGVRWLDVQGWQRSAFPSQNLTGTIERRLGEAFLLTENQVLHLPDVPPDVPESQKLTASGVVIEQPQLTLAWSSITVDVGSADRGREDAGFFGLNLAGNSVLPELATPETDPTMQSGTRLDGLQGRPQITIRHYSDGSTEVDVQFIPDSGQIAPVEIALEGPGLAGIETFHNLPIRIWGAWGDSRGSLPVANIERIEPVYPGQAIQAWLGRFEPVSLEGKEVLLFTDSSGEQYVLEFTLDGKSERTSFSPGDPVVIEGFIRSEVSLGGYPVIGDILINPGQGLRDLNSYSILSNSPIVIQESGTAGAATKGMITSIELVYYVENVGSSILTAGEPVAYVQPAWRFSGTYQDGSTFTILVQALKPEYLVQP